MVTNRQHLTITRQLVPTTNSNSALSSKTVKSPMSVLSASASVQQKRQRRATVMLNNAYTLQGFSRTVTANDGLGFMGLKYGFSANLSLQIRAVSSPSLTDVNMQETMEHAPPTNSNSRQLAAATTVTTSTNASPSEETVNSSSNTSTATSASAPSLQHQLPQSNYSVGVLQKFKRTLTNFNKHQQLQQQPQQQTMPSHANWLTVPTTTAPLPPGSAAESAFHDGAGDSGSVKYRFGPLIWRSSKERRKTKYNRRDKCNSGDSGIQIELESDEQVTRVMATSMSGGSGPSSMAAARDSAENETTTKLCSVRRTNSAEAATAATEVAVIVSGDSSSATASAISTAKSRMLKKMENYAQRAAPESLPTRSLSQPNGLETFGIGRADLDDSDTDSVTSHDEGPNYCPIFAEVLYNFIAAGPQELNLERGTLVEILRKEVGPWWFGRTKKEEASLVEEILDPELGWFPKDFVRIIQQPETDAFFLSHTPAAQQATTTITPTTAEATTVKGQSSNGSKSDEVDKAEGVDDTADDNDDTVVDTNNVTTIVIESSSYNSSGNECNGTLVPSPSLNLIIDSVDVLRRSAIKELLDTEVNYVKLLASICEGYLPAMSKRIDIFSPNSIRLIFSNITAIYKFQRKFLDSLRNGVEQNQVAKVFLKMHKGFLCYSTYCNAYPRALIELESYDRIKEAKIILDNCRESENLAELPLSAHLLAPVQRICRYPLHLGEIIKSATKSEEEAAIITNELQQLEKVDISQLDIPDTKDTIDMALEAMKSVTEAVNEGKRHSETIARHEASFQNFKGPPLHLHSTRFFLQIDATRQKQNLWNSSCTLFLFDNQLIYCKRDIIKRSQFIYKGRIYFDRCRVVNVRDGKMFGHTIKNSLRIYCEARDKWYDFSFRSANRKHRFLSTLALERQFSGKMLFVSEMTGFEYAFEERDYSDQSDYELPESESNGGLRLHDYASDAAGTGTGTSASGESSVPESPAKTAYKYSDTLPKKSHAHSEHGNGNVVADGQTGSLGRRRLGNWFRKPKSSSSTPNQSPTHKPALLAPAELLQPSAEPTAETAPPEANQSNSSSSSS